MFLERHAYKETNLMMINNLQGVVITEIEKKGERNVDRGGFL